jgi:hypothetical protein
MRAGFLFFSVFVVMGIGAKPDTATNVFREDCYVANFLDKRCLEDIRVTDSSVDDKLGFVRTKTFGFDSTYGANRRVERLADWGCTGLNAIQVPICEFGDKPFRFVDLFNDKIAHEDTTKGRRFSAVLPAYNDLKTRNQLIWFPIKSNVSDAKISSDLRLVSMNGLPRPLDGDYAEDSGCTGKHSHKPLSVRVSRRKFRSPVAFFWAAAWLGAIAFASVYLGYRLLDRLTDPRQSHNRRNRKNRN